jgi:hypothetical protein
MPPAKSVAPKNFATSLFMFLVSSFERRDALALVLVESMGFYGPVAKFDFAMWFLLPGKRVLHPVHIITFRKVFTCMGSSRFFAIGGSFCCLNAIRR